MHLKLVVAMVSYVMPLLHHILLYSCIQPMHVYTCILNSLVTLYQQYILKEKGEYPTQHNNTADHSWQGFMTFQCC